MRNPGRSAFLSVSRRLRIFRVGHKKSVLFLKLTVLIIRHRLKPFIRRILTGNLDSQMGEPAVGGSPVPVLHIGGNMDDCARKNFHSRLSLFLIPAASGHADKHLPAAVRRFVNMPVIAAAGFKGHIGDIHLFA